jgi:hypothetical protein
MREASMSWPGVGALLLALVASTAAAQGNPAPAAPRTADPALAQAALDAKAKLREKHGGDDGARIDRGVDQVARYWRPEDGDAKAFAAFVVAEFVPGGEPHDATFGRFEFALERVNGYFTSLIRDLRSFADLDRGPLLPLDRRLAGYNPAAHVSEDMFESKLAFVALLNFPLTRLEDRLAQGGTWSRRQWAEIRLAHQFASRVPAEVNAATAQAYADADAYIADYNIHMHHLLAADGKRLFPEGLRLITHWNLRDELKARYGDPEGLAKQRMIARVMDRIVTQTIPATVIDNPLLDWNPETNAVTASPVKDGQAAPGRPAAHSPDRENDERYRIWRAIYLAERQADAYSPENPTLIARRFNVNREMPEKEVRALLEAVLTSPVGPEVGRLVSARLKRPLEPFDIWYAGFKPRSKHSEDALDALTRKRYPTPEAYAADIPRLLKDLGFSAEKAQFLAEHIVVDPSRGAGHAFGAARRDDKAHLRTRVGATGMDYKGYNIAVHEMGHNVEQVFSLTTIDHTLLQGVPNNAFTEALAFVFQARDLELLGLGAPDAEAERLRVLDTFWATREIAGVALVDMDAWQWLYANPEATPAQFREAVVHIAKEVWNRHYAPIFGASDVSLLAIYSHMVASGLYTPDYPLGHFIAFQIEDHFRRANKPLGEEFERVTRIGALTPDAWMRQAVGAPVSAKPLLDAARRALDAQKGPAR